MTSRRTASDDAFAMPGGEPVGRHRTALTVTSADLPRHAWYLLGAGFRLALAAAHDHDDRLVATYLFIAPAPDRRIELRVPLDPSSPHLPSLASRSFAAGRFEREMHDLYGVVPDDHPLPRRLVRHFHWPRGWYPMRRDAGPPPEFGDTDGPYPFRPVEGQGVYEIPVGPVHAGLIEPGHFRFSVVGETILKLKARLWFVHKGIEKLFEGRTPDDAIELAERISGDTAVGHSLAFCLAVEDALGLSCSASALRDRAVLLELERLYNHVTDLGALCNDVAYAILNVHAQRVREQLLRLNESVTGHRLLRGAIRPGSTRLVRPPDVEELAAIAADVAEIADLALAHSVVRDRFAGTSILTAEQAVDLDTLGYVARASGRDIDARRDHPFVPLGPTFVPALADSGDVLARFQIRAEEFQTSVRLINDLLTNGYNPPAADGGTASPAGNGLRSGVGIVEGWRGTIVHRVELDPSGRLSRVKVVDPSFFNWPALPVALNDTIVPDFPLTNKSFNLSYAGNDL